MKKYADFSGRAIRSEFWYFYLFYMLVYVAILVINKIADLLILRLFLSFVPLAFLLPLIAVSVRRMHDVGKSGWFTLIPIYNIVLYCT